MTGHARIVVAAGRSSHGARALERGIQLANALGRPLFVLSAIPEREARSIQFLSRDAGAAEAVSEQFAERLRGEVVALGASEEMLTVHVRVGDPGDLLESTSVHRGDLLVLGRGAADRTLLAPLGDTTYRVVRNVHCSVWVEPSTWEVSAGPVLAAIDGSAHSLRALQRAHMLASSLGTALRVVHVSETGDDVDLAARCAAWIEEALGAASSDVSLETRTGDPVAGIEQASATDPPSLLVLSSLGKGSLLTRWMLGGTVYQVLRQLGCPVLVDREIP